MFLFRHCHLSKLRNFILTTFLLTFTLGIGYTLTRCFDYDSVMEYIQNLGRPKTLLNITHFRFIENPKHICTIAFPEVAGRKTIITVVHSARPNFLNREIIRRTYGAVEIFKGWYIKTVFMLGLSSPTDDAETDYLLENEVKEHGDIILGNFVDTFRNLSYKHLAGYKWAIDYCPEANYYLKSDDDVVVDIFHAIEFLSSNKSQTMENNYYCAKYPGMAPARDVTSPYKVTKEEFPGEKYPDFCSFGVFLTSIGTATRILTVSNSKEFLYLEEVFVSGILRELANSKAVGDENNTIGFVDVPSGFFEKDDKLEGIVKKGYFGVIPINKSPNASCLIWNSILQGRSLVNFYTSTCQALF